MWASKARTGLRAGYVCHRRWTAYGKYLPLGPEVRAVCGKAARTDPCGGREVTHVPTATSHSLGRCQADLPAEIFTRPEPHRAGLCEAQAYAAKMGCAHCRNHCAAIGELLQAFKPEECANFFK